MMRAIKTLEDIRQRCHVNDDGEWIWKYCTNRNKTPYAKTPHHGNGVTITVLRLAWCLHNGIAYDQCPHERVWNKSGNSLDVNPRNAVVGTIAEHNATKGPRQKGMRARIITMKGVATRGRKFTPDQIQHIRTCCKTERALQEEFAAIGITVSRAMIGRIRRGEDYNELARGASIFSMGLAA
jgi:hypothetical protein